MAPATGTAILTLVVFVLPGFVSLRYGERTYVTKAEGSPFERLLNALYASSLTYAIVLSAGYLLFKLDARDIADLYNGRRALSDYVALASALFVVPLVIAEVARRWSRSEVRRKYLRWARISPVHRTPSGWEHFFLSDQSAWLRVTLNDGRVIGGYFGASSFAGYTSDTPDLYLEQRWELDDDDWFVQAAPRTLGVYVRADAIVTAEFYAVAEHRASTPDAPVQ